MTDTITVSLGQRSYPIHIGSGLLSAGNELAQSTDATQLLIITNEIVAPLYLDRVEQAFAEREPKSLILPDGEQYKNLDSFARIIDELIEGGFHRDACILALGGGVIGDLAGYAAASYQRGIDFVQLPTTLLAQVDSSVGGKTAVNHPQAKNMIGAFHQPVAVISDTDTLGTLPQRELSAGLAEVIKYGLIEDAEFFRWLEDNIAALLALDPEALRVAIRRCCEIKALIVAQDELEHGKRALLNLGHTFGHAIEALGGYGRWLHGEAVAIGMLMAAETSELLGHIDRAVTERIGELIARAGLPTHASGLSVSAILDRMQLDKKAGKAGLKLVLLDGLGSAYVCPAPDRPLLESSIERRLSEQP
ncbi:MAG TPA: 3-dehydroquinate synthase [Gammaproteobacteria bacterium]|jgi:3-dehydroquinate synthase